MDFSHLIIQELRKFYENKHTAFSKYLQSCTDLCEIAHDFYILLEPSHQKISNCIQSFTDASTEENRFHITNFIDQLGFEILYAAEELEGIRNSICRMHEQVKPPLNLKRFTYASNTSKVTYPYFNNYVYTNLWNIANEITRIFFHSPLLYFPVTDKRSFQA